MVWAWLAAGSPADVPFYAGPADGPNRRGQRRSSVSAADFWNVTIKKNNPVTQGITSP